MRVFDAQPQIVQDLKEESKIVTSKEHAGLKVTAARHPTLGKIVIVETEGGDGIIVETEE